MGQQSSKHEQKMPPCSAGQEAMAGISSGQSNCPVPDEIRTGQVYNVYNQPIDATSSSQINVSGISRAGLLDPKNNMPLEANQEPFPGQRKLLSTQRQESTIPKGGTDAAWTYPSPQMFYNGALSGCLFKITLAVCCCTRGVRAR